MGLAVVANADASMTGTDSARLGIGQPSTHGGAFVGKTKIEWCDYSWNCWIGCAKVSPACDHCYAEDMMDHRYGRVRWGIGEDRVRTSATTWAAPFKWDRAAAAAGKPATVFCLSLGDIWDNEVDPQWRRDAFAVMEQTPNLIYLLLSKRIGNAEKMCDPRAGNPCLPQNAALGATMINQEEWSRDLPKLKRAKEALGARFSFASVEPMLGPIDAMGDFPDWVIVGGESGHKARPMNPVWVRSLRDQCAAAGVAFHFKQWGEWVSVSEVEGPGCHFRFPDGRTVRRVGKKHAGRRLDGREHNGFPAPTEDDR